MYMKYDTNSLFKWFIFSIIHLLKYYTWSWSKVCYVLCYLINLFEQEMNNIYLSEPFTAWMIYSFHYIKLSLWSPNQCTLSTFITIQSHFKYSVLANYSKKNIQNTPVNFTFDIFLYLFFTWLDLLFYCFINR